jgi:imidazolonepropionase-like amidohydrolase
MFRFLPVLAIMLAPAADAATAFVNVNVVPMTSERVLIEQTVIVDNGVIVAIGPVDDIPIPETATVVDGTDRYLMPGLGEMHAHVPAGGTSLDRTLALFAANGVTTIRGMLGQVSHLELRQDLNAGRVFGPRLVTSGPSFNGNSVNGARDAERRVREQHAAGYDFLKIHPGLSREEFMAIANTANELGIPFAGHVPVSVGVEGALQSGIATIDHLDGYMAAMLPRDSGGAGGVGGFFGVFIADDVDPGRLDVLVAKTVTAGTWNVPTEILIEQRINATPPDVLGARSDMSYAPSGAVAEWMESKEALLEDRNFDRAVADRAIALRRELIQKLFAANGRILLGSDAPQVFNVPGFATHLELSTYVEAGLTPFEALSTGTTAVAEFLGTNTGSVHTGKDADLVLLDDNPLKDIENARRVHGVMLRGQWFSRQDLDARIRPFRRAEER